VGIPIFFAVTGESIVYRVIVLAVDTTSERESVALVEGGAVRGEVRLRTRDGHSQRVLPAIEFLLRAAGLRGTEVEGFAVAVGPGSFTGLRVGLSTVQGLALAAGRPCLGVSTLDVLAAEAAGEAPIVVAVVDGARTDQVFAALYDAQARRLDEPRAETLDALLARVTGPAVFVGDGALRHRDAIRARHPEARFAKGELYLAGMLGRMAEPRLAAGEGVPPGALRPLYLRPAEIRKSAP
jgi:tRNA threonylcarbamoyladenosine biosynthesis protein TsaB